MYQVFYGLSSKPFQLNPDPSFYFSSKQHRRAKAYLEYGVQRNEGFIVITGEVGAGKTTIVRGLLESLDSMKVVAANLVTTQLDAEDTLRMVGAAFGVRVKDVSKADVLMALEAYLINQTSQGKRCLLIVDEAQNLTARAVEELRMLSNFQFGQQALLQTFLVGQPEFRAILQSPTMQQLRQRVTATCHIGPLDLDETRGYIEHRLKCAGSSGRPTFNMDAFEGVFKASGGIPRRINLICDRLLLLGFLSSKDAFGLDDVNEVVCEIHDESTVPENMIEGEGAGWDDAGIQARKPTGAVDIDFAKLQVTPKLADAISSQVDGLEVEQYDSRLRRLERSVLRLERINLECLGMLKQLVAAVRKPSQESNQ
ncbi:putative secretion ATPase, PEP-CTERM locus subfamily [Polaromonas sp. OV174]|uniref:XrtA/PEP-CTERM system-associated ATPase n=1 Tax=Polaromonas sp. OV174 TaxID=1855300 RepID=UPI0008F1B720|nr:XrtA/PEP-CTERM system-associated ATPase [Polaromonas sp. OV174]SFC65911.1 putative secretion ATPase, PEP-CTERM locus subfamily [Polaromonas sp. OV174]